MSKLISKPKITCIIQARCGSTRLPNKVLKTICGKSILEHDIDRIKRSKKIDEIIVATTDLERDNVIVKEVNKLSINVFRGSEEDVLSRYYYCARNNNCDIIVRITSDCPLIDNNLIDKIIEYYLSNYEKYDYVSNTICRTFPRGLDVEVFNFDSLEKAFLDSESKRDREHVTPYIWDNPHLFRIGQYTGNKDYSNFRWTLDTEDDFKLINKIYNYLYKYCGNDFSMQDILDLYDKDKELYNINKNIMQKEI